MPVCVLSEAITSLPLHLYEYTDDGGKVKAVKHPLYPLLHDEPDPEMTSYIFRETMKTHLLLWGERLCPGHPERAGRGCGALSTYGEPDAGRP